MALNVCQGQRLFVVLVLLVVSVLADFQENRDPFYLNDSNEYPNYQIGVRYDEYPVVVPKRAALLLDRLMVALKQAMEEEQSSLGDRVGNRSSPKPRSLPISPEDMMGLQRRGHNSLAGQTKGRIYWRCYFNAVTCFKRKRQN